MADASLILTSTLQQLRKTRRLSQLELAFELGVSQRHVSFVESGRAQPSRRLLLAWLQVLAAPLAQRNEALLAAGYAPAFTAARLGEPLLAEADLALACLLEAHEPVPALVLDAEWNVLRMNRGALWLATTLVPWLQEALDSEAKGDLNMLDLIAHPDGLARRMTNLEDVGPRFLTLLRHELVTTPRLLPRVQAYEALLRDALGAATAAPAERAHPPAPVLTSSFASPYGELAFFSMFTTFGTPTDITLASLRVEHLFPADSATRKVLESEVSLV